MIKTKRTMLISLLSLLISIAMLIGTTFAWFTDSVTSGKNKIIAGNLDVDLVMYDSTANKYVSIADEEAAIFGGEGSLAAKNDSTDTLWEPGKTQVVFLGVMNKGSLALNYSVKLTVAGELAPALEYAVVDGAKPESLTTVTDWTTLKAAATDTNDVAEGVITAAGKGVLDEIVNGIKDEADYFALAVHMKETADNTYMGKKVTIDVKIEATQMSAESDSFDNKYDKADEDDTQDAPDAVWFDCTKSGDKPTDVLSVGFTKTVPASYDATWTAPRNSVAYYNKTAKALTYVPNGTGFKFSDDNILKFGYTPLPGFVTDDAVLEYWNNNWAQFFGDATYTTVDEFKASENGEYYDLVVYELGDGYGFDNVASITGLDLWDVSAVHDFSLMFSTTKVTTLDLSGWNTANATSMHGMFDGCGSLETITLGAGWSTAKVNDFNSMFTSCVKLKTVPISGWNTASAVDMACMFYECSVLTEIDVSSFDTGNVTSMASMFMKCDGITALDISSFDTEKVEDMVSMFASCPNLEHIYVGSEWTVENVVPSKGYGLFSGTPKLPNVTSLSPTGMEGAKLTTAGGYLELKPQP